MISVDMSIDFVNTLLSLKYTEHSLSVFSIIYLQYTLSTPEDPGELFEISNE